MNSAALLADAFGRIHDLVNRVTDGLDAEALAWRPQEEANSIAWLVWHLTRIQDDHVAEIAGVEQRWISGGHAAAFGRPADPSDTGYGHSPAQVAAIRPASPAVLRDYHDAVAAMTLEHVGTIDDAALDRVIDTSWDPPVTVGVRLVSVLGDAWQHLGQAAYVRGLYERGVEPR